MHLRSSGWYVLRAAWQVDHLVGMGFSKSTVQKVQNTICVGCTCDWHVLQELSPQLDLGQLLERLLAQRHNVTQVAHLSLVSNYI